MFAYNVIICLEKIFSELFPHIQTLYTERKANSQYIDF